MGCNSLGHRLLSVIARTVSGGILEWRYRTLLTDIVRGRALSRSAKKVLHVDKNDFYGGAEAALSLQEIESWIEKVNNGLVVRCHPSPSC